MKRLIPIIISMILLSSSHSNSQIVYPLTAKDNVVDIYFGVEVKEPYRWLENDTSVATSAWVKAQNKATFNYLGQIHFRNDLKKRLTALMNYPKYGSPFKKNGQYFYFKNNGLQNQSVLYRQATLTSEPEVLLDPNTFSNDGTVALHAQSFSKNGKYLGYSIARSGSDWNEIFVMDVVSKQVLSDHIVWSKSSGISWQGDGFYYSAYDAPVPGKEYSNKNEYEKVYYHTVGQLQSQDKLIYENKKFPLRECYPIVTDDEKYLFITETETTTGNELLIKDLSIPDARFELLAPGFENDYTVVDHVKGKIYILTNWKAPKQRLMEVDPANHSRENWKEIIPQSENVLERTSIIGGKILAEYMKDASNHAYGFDLTGKKLFEITLPTLGTLTGFSGDQNDNEAF